MNVQEGNIVAQLFLGSQVVDSECFLVSCTGCRFVLSSVLAVSEIPLLRFGFSHEQVRKAEALLTVKTPYTFMP